MDRRCDGELLILRSLMKSREVLVDIEVGLCIRSDHSNDRSGLALCKSDKADVDNSDRHPCRGLYTASRSEH